MALTNTAEALSCYWIGQVTIKQLEKFLWLLEKCSQWSLPPADETGKENVTIIRPQLTRPLPWIFFLPTLMMLRMWREIISFTTVLRGGEPLTAAQMVKCFQNSRRSLRAIKYHGIRYRRLQNQITADEEEDKDPDMFSNWAKWFNNLIFFKSIEYNRRSQAVDAKKDKLETESQNKEEDPMTRKKRQLSVDEGKMNGGTENDEEEEEDEWEDDGEENEDAFNPDEALRELATKIDELASDPEDSDYSDTTGDHDTTGLSVSADEEEVVDVIEDVKIPSENDSNNIQQNSGEIAEVKDENSETKSKSVEHKDKDSDVIQKAEGEEGISVNTVDSKKRNGKKRKSPNKSNADKKSIVAEPKKMEESKVDQPKEEISVSAKADNGSLKKHEDASASKKETVPSNTVTDKLDGNNELLKKDISQVELPSQKVHTSLPIFKAESMNLPQSVQHKAQPIQKAKNGNSGPVTKPEFIDKKPNFKFQSNAFIEGEKQFNNQVTKTASKPSDVSEPSTKINVRERVKMKRNKYSVNNNAISNNNNTSSIYNMKANGSKEIK